MDVSITEQQAAHLAPSTFGDVKEEIGSVCQTGSSLPTVADTLNELSGLVGVSNKVGGMDIPIQGSSGLNMVQGQDCGGGIPLYQQMYQQTAEMFDHNTTMEQFEPAKTNDNDEHTTVDGFITRRRGRTPEHPCWELMQPIRQENCMVCRLCSKRIMWINTRNAMQHLKSCNPQIGEELERIWQTKLQLRADVNRFTEDSCRSDPSKRRGRATQHPTWYHFERVERKGAICKLCGVRVAYACSGNLMKHLKSRHVPEFVIAQKQWDDILMKRRRLCEVRLLAAAGESCGNSPQQEFPVYDVDDDDDEVAQSPASRSLSRDGANQTPGASEDNAPAMKMTTGGSQGGENEEGKQSEGSLSVGGTAIVSEQSTGDSVNETITRILLSMGLPSSSPVTRPSAHTISSQSDRRDYTPTLSAGALSPTMARSAETSTPRQGTIASRRIQSFVNTLSEDLASFPLEKSLLYMRQIRKFMDERLLESDNFTFNSEDDVNLG